MGIIVVGVTSIVVKGVFGDLSALVECRGAFLEFRHGTWKMEVLYDRDTRIFG